MLHCQEKICTFEDLEKQIQGKGVGQVRLDSWTPLMHQFLELCSLVTKCTTPQCVFFYAPLECVFMEEGYNGK